MGYHPRIESGELAQLSTIRSRNAELWFINNHALEDAILGYAARFSTRYQVRLYGIGIEGNHLHCLAQYPEANRASFQRDLNSCIARAVTRHAESYHGGTFWARRYSAEFIPDEEDIEKYFFYVVLQAVNDGLVDRISDYPGYNCFTDAINGTTRKFKTVRWAEYNERKRWDPSIKIADYTETAELKFSRLPGYEHLSQDEYRKLMLKKLEAYRLEILARRKKTPLGPAACRAMRPGTLPQHTKQGDRYTYRPRILCSSPKRYNKFLAWYFEIYWTYRECSELYRKGDLSVQFPPGTYRPPVFTCKALPIESV